MTNYLKIPTWADSGHVHAVVDTPRGSRAKLEFIRSGRFTLAKPPLAGPPIPTIGASSRLPKRKMATLWMFSSFTMRRRIQLLF